MSKTYALCYFIKGLNSNQYQRAYISPSTISVTEFYEEICTVLGLEASEKYLPEKGVLFLLGEAVASGVDHQEIQ